jgi:sortase A
MKANSKRGLLFIIIGVVLIAFAFAFVCYNYYVSYVAGKNSEIVVEQLDKEISDNDDEGFGINKNMEMPIIKIGNNDYIGTIEIPELNLNLPVMSSWSYDNLNISPCRYSGSVYTSNLVIAGHNYATHFGKLRSLNIGDEVKFTDSDGNVFLYEVKDVEILIPTDVEEMKNSDWDLTLFTCTIGAKTRLAVRCGIISTT